MFKLVFTIKDVKIGIQLNIRVVLTFGQYLKLVFVAMKQPFER